MGFWNLKGYLLSGKIQSRSFKEVSMLIFVLGELRSEKKISLNWITSNAETVCFILKILELRKIYYLIFSAMWPISCPMLMVYLLH